MELIETFKRHFSKDPVLVARGPGRVNLLGEHVDYNDGLVLPAAIDREVRLAAAPSGDDTISLEAIDLRQQVSFRLTNLADKVDLQGNPLPALGSVPGRCGLVSPGCRAEPERHAGKFYFDHTDRIRSELFSRHRSGLCGRLAGPVRLES